MLKIQHPGGRFKSHMKRIRISILERVFGSEKVKFGLVIRISEVWIRISILKSISEGKKVKFGLVIRIPISESFLNSEKVKFGLWIQIPKGWIRISSVKLKTKATICISKKNAISLHVQDIFWLGLFLTKVKIRSKTSYSHLQII